MKTLQIYYQIGNENENLVRYFNKRPRKGWYTVHYNGVMLDLSTVCAVKRNPRGEIAEK